MASLEVNAQVTVYTKILCRRHVHIVTWARSSLENSSLHVGLSVHQAREQNRTQYKQTQVHNETNQRQREVRTERTLPSYVTGAS